MISLCECDCETVEKTAEQYGVILPIEQTESWRKYQDTVPGRSAWKNLIIEDDGKPAGSVSFIKHSTHGYYFLRSAHGPVWFDSPDQTTEKSRIQALAKYVKENDKSIVFLRSAVSFDSNISCRVLSTVPYDTTVVIDLTGGDEQIISRMKKRGRRDVRKALRDCPAVITDDTKQVIGGSFDEYYEIMTETGNRDGFVPAPKSDYKNMIECLGYEHCRVFGARINGKLCAWSIITINKTHAVRYYAAMRTEAMRSYITDRLTFAECSELSKLGVQSFDLMGIGSDFAPSLNGLNTFKTKFSQETRSVVPERDIPIKKMFYSTLKTMKKIKNLKH